MPLPSSIFRGEGTKSVRFSVADACGSAKSLNSTKYLVSDVFGLTKSLNSQNFAPVRLSVLNKEIEADEQSLQG